MELGLREPRFGHESNCSLSTYLHCPVSVSVFVTLTPGGKHKGPTTVIHSWEPGHRKLFSHVLRVGQPDLHLAFPTTERMVTRQYRLLVAFQYLCPHQGQWNPSP